MSDIKWLYGLLKEDKKRYLLALLLAVIIASSSVIVPHVTRKIVDEFITHEFALINIVENKDRLIYLISFVILFTLFKTSMAFVTMMMFENASQNVLYNLRLDLYDNLQRQDKEFYSKNTSGDIMSTMTSDLDMIRHSIAWLIKTMIESLAVFVAAIIYLGTINLKLTIWMSVLSPIIFFLTNRLSKEVRPMYQTLRKKFAILNSAAQENIAANRTIKAFSTQNYEIEKFNEISKEFRKANENASLTWIKYNPTLEFLSQSFAIILLLIGGLYIMNETISYGDFAAYSSLIWAISNPMKNIGVLINDVQRISVSSEKIQELQNAKSKITKDEYIEEPIRLNGEIEFKDVSFVHEDGSSPVLKNINFKINAKGRIALIGPTGSGKTTLINLLMRQYNPTIGSVLVDGEDIRTYPLDAYQANIAITTQSVVLFSDSIKNNIGYGMKDYDEKRILDAAFAAFAHEFIVNTDGGYETVIGEDGVGLSGGQQQRLALARAFASNRPILILDDTTSALDNRTEKLILKSLDFMRHQSTQFIITQRVSTAAEADLILVLDNGEIIEQGTHADLMNLKAYYYNMHQIQETKKEEEVDG